MRNLLIFIAVLALTATGLTALAQTLQTERKPVQSETLRPAKPFNYYAQDSQHSAFPGSVRLTDGRLLVVYRQGSNHYQARDGKIVATWSSDLGVSWTAPTTILPYPGGGLDLRDPSVSLSADGLQVYLTYFKGTAANGGAGSFFRSSDDGGVSWSSEVRIDSGVDSSAITSPVVVAGSRLLAFHYAKAPGDSFWSVYKAASDDGGLTWASARLVNGQADGRDYPEPYAVTKGNRVFLFFRWGANSTIGSMDSSDGGENWTTPVARFPGSGRPSAVWLSNGSIGVALRDVNNGRVSVRVTTNEGATWLPPRVLQYAPDHGMSTYASFTEVAPGQVFTALSAEDSSGTSSKLAFTYLAFGAQYTPLGLVPGDAVAAVAGYDDLVASSVFTSPEWSTLPYPWAGSGAAVVANGQLQSASADNIPDYVVQSTSGPDHVVSALLRWDGSAGLGILLRYRDANNWLLFTSESGGSVLRLYKAVSGTVTQLAAASWSVTPGAFHEYKASIRGGQVRAGVDGDINLRYDLTSAENTALTGWSAGVKLNSQSGGVNLCRRLVISAA